MFAFKTAKIMINKWLSKAVAFFLYLISLLPLSILYIIADIIFVILYYIIKYRRKVVYQNLINSFPNKSETELKVIEKKYFKYLADLMVETIKTLSVNPSKIFKRFTYKNLELLEKLATENKSFILAVGHYGNWEWSALTTPMVSKHTPLIVYKPMNNPVFNDLFKKTREKSGSKLVPMKGIVRKMIECKNELTFSVFAADQTPTSKGSFEFFDFLNQPTAVFTGIEKIAKSTNYPVVFCDMSVNKRGYYQAEFVLITENPKNTDNLEITERYNKLLEQKIMQTPQYWLWSHKRWKIKPTNR